MAIEDTIQQLLPYLLQQPASRADLLAQAGQLYNPTYDQQYSEAQGDYSRVGGRLGQDYGIQQGILGRQKDYLGYTQGQAQGAQKEQLAQMGLGAAGGIGDLQRENLSRSQLIDRQGLQDQFDASTLGNQRGTEDLGIQQFRGLRQVNRNRNAAIEGYATNPAYQFPQSSNYQPSYSPSYGSYGYSGY